MHHNVIKALCIFIVLCSACSQNKNNSTSGNSVKTIEDVKLSIKVLEIASGLSSPVGMVDISDQSNKFLVIEQSGLIKVIENEIVKPEIFLNLKDKMVTLNSSYDERGLLGICLHPNYPTNGLFYVYYSAPSNVAGSNHKSVIAEYKTSKNKNSSEGTGRIVLEVEQPESNHNGGQLAFGPDGFLYIALGDGGGANDEHGEHGNAQHLNTLLGKILRIDVSGSPYTIPKDNPFINQKNARPEIFAYGLRNPWRFSFDKKTGKLFCADVGQNKYEEINIITSAGNYGWRIMEGLHCFNPANDCNKENITLPIHEYTHEVGQSVTGGFVYRGSSMKDLYGKYIFGDWTGPLFFLKENSEAWTSGEIEITNRPKDIRILSFAEDLNGELYILTSKEVSPKSFTGSIYRIVSI